MRRSLEQGKELRFTDPIQELAATGHVAQREGSCIAMGCQTRRTIHKGQPKDLLRSETRGR